MLGALRVAYRNYTPEPQGTFHHRERNELKDHCEHKSDRRHGRP